MIRWSLFLIFAGAVTGYALWVYHRVDLAVAGARSLAWVRATALVLLVALLFDPAVPGRAAGSGGTRWVLLDATLSMLARDAGGESAWAGARARATELSGQGWRVVTFGDGVGVAGVPPAEPADAHTVVTPALARAVEGGASEVLVLTDARLEDRVALSAALDALPVRVGFEVFGEGVVDAGVSRFEVADVPRPGERATAEVEVHAEGAADSLTLEVREEGRIVATRRLSPPSAGLTRAVTVDLPPPEREGRVRYTAAVTIPGDGYAADDTAVAYATVGHEEGALVLVSLSPDWEPRVLLPLLGDVTGLPTAGFLRVGADRFVGMGRATERGAPADSAAVRAAVADAALLVVHGLGAGADAWARRLLDAGRALVFVRDVEGAALTGLSVRAPNTDEWYASSEIPPSPIAGELAGAELLGLPPLSDVLVREGRGDGSVPLRVQLRGTGPGQPALELLADAGRRRAVVLVEGFWRWASRDGAPSDAYRRLWSGVAGWLLGDAGVAGPEVRPTAWVFERGVPTSWRVPGDSTESVRVRVSLGDSVVTDTLARAGSPMSTGPYPPGAYGYRAETPAGVERGSGRFDVARATSEMAVARWVPPAAPERVAGASAGAGNRRPLRTSPWPYLLVIVLLCAEWIGRRRIGLR